MKKHPSSRQMKYAREQMDGNKTKQQCAINAGYSLSSARVPKLIENKAGYHLARSQIYGELGNTTMQIMSEIQARGFKQMDNKTLISSLKVISEVHGRYNPSDMTKTR